MPGSREPRSGLLRCARNDVADSLGACTTPSPLRRQGAMNTGGGAAGHDPGDPDGPASMGPRLRGDNEFGAHHPFPGTMEMEPEARRSAVAPGSTTTVVNGDSTIAGPASTSPGRIASKRRTVAFVCPTPGK